MNYLTRIGDRLSAVEKGLQSLKVVEKKVEDFDQELKKKLWTATMDKDKTMNDRVSKKKKK